MRRVANAAYGSVPFQEQIEFFRRKLKLPSEDWTQLYQQAHDLGFVVAGANRDDLVADFFEAVDQAISQGTTREQFLKDFDAIVAKYGWNYKGTRGWRSNIIYQTNLRMSYAGGRYRQLKANTQAIPYWTYRHSNLDKVPRILHITPAPAGWNGLTLRHDDPWWDTHWPPNGWGCTCYVSGTDARGLARAGKSGPDPAPPINWETKTIGTHGAHPRTVQVPEGIDPGFGYAPGQISNLVQQARTALSEEVETIGKRERLIKTNWKSYGRPEEIPLSPFHGTLLPEAPDRTALAREITQLLGAPSQLFMPGGVPVVLDAAALADYVKLNRTPFVPLMVETLAHPWEVWANVERTSKGYYEVMIYIIQGYRAPGGKQVWVMADASHGLLRAWNYVATSDPAEIQKRRQGILLWPNVE